LRAASYEAAHPERLTYRAQVYRSYWCASSEMRRLAITRGWMGALIRKEHTIPVNVVIAGCWLIAAVLLGVISLEAFKAAALEAGKKAAKSGGRAAALLGILPQPYAIVVGM
jgi:hypothetical protein